MNLTKSSYSSLLKGRQTSYVYLAVCLPPTEVNDVYKIGRSNRPIDRFYGHSFGKDGIAMQYPFPVKILACYESVDARYIESAMHELNKNSRYSQMYGEGNTEWFQIDPYGVDMFLDQCLSVDKFAKKKSDRVISIEDYSFRFRKGDARLWDEWYRFYSPASTAFMVRSMKNRHAKLDLDYLV